MTGRAESRYFTSNDGLKLHLLDFRPDDDAGRLPAVCLPGLTRGARDFALLGHALAFEAKRPRRVVAFDYRGRGRSDHDPDWRHYDLATERADFLVGLAELGIAKAHFVGTSRGGLHIMAMASEHADKIAAAVLNDIGPVLEPEGLQRIKGYIGRMAQPKTYDEAIKLLKIGAAQHFDGLSPTEWRVFAATTFGDDEANLHLAYDPQLARTLDGFDLAKPLPDSWELFDKLAGKPLLAIRGANSDLLSRETLAAMERRWPGVETVEVAGQGHAPLLADAATIRGIAEFLARAD